MIDIGYCTASGLVKGEDGTSVAIGVGIATHELACRQHLASQSVDAAMIVFPTAFRCVSAPVLVVTAISVRG
jgi:hypothetical protein